MSRDEAVAILRAHADELRSRGVRRLALFGSRLRGDHRVDSDVDLLVDFDPNRKLSLIERNIERVSEASRHLPETLSARHPEIPWRAIADMQCIPSRL